MPRHKSKVSLCAFKKAFMTTVFKNLTKASHPLFRPFEMLDKLRTLENIPARTTLISYQSFRF